MTVLVRWLRLDPGQRLLLLRAVAALCTASLRIRLVPFPKIAASLGTMQPPQSDAAAATAQQAERARSIRWAVGAAARRLPFECACLAQALAAHRLACADGLAPTLHMGAQRGQQGRGETHAWLSAAGVGVTGYPLPPDMVEVGCFPS